MSTLRLKKSSKTPRPTRRRKARTKIRGPKTTAERSIKGRNLRRPRLKAKTKDKKDRRERRLKDREKGMG